MQTFKAEDVHFRAAAATFGVHPEGIYSLTHSLTHSLTRSLTHSLTRSHSCMLSALTNTPITNTPTAREYLGPELAAVL